jgi:hypothetical protein
MIACHSLISRTAPFPDLVATLWVDVTSASSGIRGGGSRERSKQHHALSSFWTDFRLLIY